MKSVKFSVFSDYHYCQEAYPIFTDGLFQIVNRAHDNNVDAILHCGDFLHDSVNDTFAFNTIFKNKYNIPAYGCYGNHELERVPSLEALNKAYGVEKSYHYVDIKGFRVIITDTNHYRKDGQLYHYAGYSWGGCTTGGFDTNCLGDEQLDWLKETIDSSPYPCIILSHASFEKDSYGSEDAGKVREIINNANKAHKGKVLMCMNGHYHRNNIAVMDNIVYFDINATYNGEWVPQVHDLFPDEFVRDFRMCRNCAIFRDPLNAIVTVYEDGTIDIEGMESSYMYDVAPELFGGPRYNEFGRKCEPRISSAHIKLDI